MSDFRFITSDNIPLDTSTDNDVYVEGQPLIYFSREQYIKLLACVAFTSPEPFTLATANSRKNWDGTLEYSTDRSTWSIWDGTTTLSSSGNKIYLRGTGNTRITGGFGAQWVLTGSNISCIGNIENLLDYQTVARGEHPAMGNYCYYYMFCDCTSLVSAPKLSAMSLTNDCYGYMFYNCTSLIFAPELPATTLANSCYETMFYNCTSLVSAPKLPAIALQIYCYYHMFYGCTSLTTIPELPATTIPSISYENMFYGCTSIKLSVTQTGRYQIPYRIPSSGTGTIGTDSLDNMFGETGGTFKGTPEINTTYYLSTSNSVIPAN